MITDKEIKKYVDGTPYSFKEIKMLVKQFDLNKDQLDASVHYSLRYAVSLEEAVELAEKLVKEFGKSGMKSEHIITEEVFYDKELCDALREVALKSALCLNDALVIIQQSADLDRDIPIIKSLANAGYEPRKIEHIIKVLNPDVRS